MSDNVEDLAELIKKQQSISLTKLQDDYDFDTEELRRKLHELIDSKVISFSKMYICGECGLRLGLIEDLHDIEKIKCPFCGYQFTLTNDYIEVFFFTS